LRKVAVNRLIPWSRRSCDPSVPLHVYAQGELVGWRERVGVDRFRKPEVVVKSARAGLYRIGRRDPELLAELSPVLTAIMLMCRSGDVDVDHDKSVLFTRDPDVLETSLPEIKVAEKFYIFTSVVVRDLLTRNETNSI
jgi:hypothetical protein